MPPFLGSQCWFSFDDKIPFPAAKATWTRRVRADLFCLYLCVCVCVCMCVYVLKP